MRSIALFVASCVLAGAASAAEPVETVTFESEGLTLTGWLAKPDAERFPGPRPALVWNHGSEKKPRAAAQLAAPFLERGFVVFWPVRHGHEPSPGEYISDVVARETTKDARGARLVEQQELANKDVMNAVAWLAARPFVDKERMVVAGCSYGGIQTLLAAEKGGFKAAIAFAPGAMSWNGSPRLVERLHAAAAARKVPLLVLQAENDYSTEPAKTLGADLAKSPLPGRAKLFPAFGDPSNHADGHGGFAIRGAAVWGPDVFPFIDAALGSGLR